MKKTPKHWRGIVGYACMSRKHHYGPWIFGAIKNFPWSEKQIQRDHDRRTTCTDKIRKVILRPLPEKPPRPHKCTKRCRHLTSEERKEAFWLAKERYGKALKAAIDGESPIDRLLKGK